MLGSIQPVGAGMTGQPPIVGANPIASGETGGSAASHGAGALLGRENPLVGSLIGGSQQLGSAGLGSVANPMFGGTTDALGGSRAIEDVQSSVSQLLTGLGGAIDDKLLQMLIALIILSALLEQMRGESGGQGDALSALGGRGQGGQQGGYFSSTTISIEQTTTTIHFQFTESYSTGGGLENVSPSGSRIDVSA